MNNLKVLIVAEGLEPSMGGQFVSITNLYDSLINDVSVLQILAGYSNNDLMLDSSITERNITYFKYFTIFKISPSLFFSLFHKREEFDIIHCNGIWNLISFCCLLFCFIFNKKFVISPRGMASKSSVSRSLFRSLYFKFIQLPILNAASFVHVTSEIEKDDMFYLGVKNRFLIAPNGIKNFPFFEYDSVSTERMNKKVISFVGRICKFKNLDLLINSFAKLSEKYSDWSIYVAGPIEDYDYYNMIISSDAYQKNKSNIIFLGELDNEQLHKLYLSTSFLVCCSESENFGLSIVEALWHGVPSVCPVNSIWSTYNLPHFYPVLPDSNSVLNSLRFYMDSYVYDRTSFNLCRQLSLPFSWSNQSKILLSEYQKLLSD